MDSIHKKQFIRYVTAGALCVFVEIAVFSVCQLVGWQYLVSNTVGFGAASVLGYFLQKYYTFQNRSSNHVEQGIKFALVLAWGYLFGSIVLYVLITVLGVPVWVSKSVQLVAVLCSNYIGQHFFTFKHHDPRP